MKLRLVLVLLLFPACASAQGGFVHDVVLQKQTLANPSITYAKPIAGASIRVCTGGGTPCTPTAVIYSNSALTQVKSNPTSTDTNGNFSFWAIPGPYTVGITVNGVYTNFEYTVDYTNPASIAPTVGAANQILYNNGLVVTGSQDLQWNNTTKVFTIGTSGSPLFRLTSDSGAAKMILGTNVAPFMENFGSIWGFRALNDQDVTFGTVSDPTTYVFAANSGPSGLGRGALRMGTGSAHGELDLNDGSASSGLFQGVKILVGTEADPNGVWTARPGSMFLSTSGGAAATLWIKETLTTNMGWVAK